MPNIGFMLAESGVSTAALDFSDTFTTALSGINSDFSKYALIAVPVAIGIWAAPKVIKLVMKFFNSLTH